MTEPAVTELPEVALGAWLRRTHAGAPVELVTRHGAVEISAGQWLALVEAGVALFAPEWRRALNLIETRGTDR